MFDLVTVRTTLNAFRQNKKKKKTSCIG